VSNRGQRIELTSQPVGPLKRLEIGDCASKWACKDRSTVEAKVQKAPPPGLGTNDSLGAAGSTTAPSCDRHGSSDEVGPQAVVCIVDQLKVATCEIASQPEQLAHAPKSRSSFNGHDLNSRLPVSLLGQVFKHTCKIRPNQPNNSQMWVVVKQSLSREGTLVEIADRRKADKKSRAHSPQFTANWTF
jgi:hypothetical protein